jgi:hypothetical protein
LWYPTSGAIKLRQIWATQSFMDGGLPHLKIEMWATQAFMDGQTWAICLCGFQGRSKVRKTMDTTEDPLIAKNRDE